MILEFDRFLRGGGGGGGWPWLGKQVVGEQEVAVSKLLQPQLESEGDGARLRHAAFSIHYLSPLGAGLPVGFSGLMWYSPFPGHVVLTVSWTVSNIFFVPQNDHQVPCSLKMKISGQIVWLWSPS